MHRKWSFLINPFTVASRRGYHVAYNISLATDAYLLAQSGDLAIAALYAFYHPLHLAFETAYIAWLSHQGTQEGATKTADQLLFEMAFGNEDLGIESKLNEWDLDVQGVFHKGTPDYLAIFPDGHKPFQKGEKNQRILTLKAFSTKLGTYGDPAIAALKLLVDAFLLSLDTARTTQLGEISITKTDSSDIKTKMVSAMQGLMYVYGGLVMKFYNNLDAIAPFFDLELIRNLSQSNWDESLDVSETKFGFKRTLDGSRKVKVTVLTSEPVRCAVTEEENDPIGMKFIEVPGLEDQVMLWSDLTASNTATFFKMQNMSGLVPANVKVEILPEGA